MLHCQHYLLHFQRGCSYLQDNKKLKECIEEIEKWFRFDTITLLDCVLTDDLKDPEYSANTVYYRLEDTIEFQALYYGVKYHDVTDFLIKNGYSNDDIDLLNQKRIDENRRFNQ